MYNANDPDQNELPSSAQLLKSTFIALAVAVVILVVIVLPAEYAIDPTGAGSALGLTRMGEIKAQLSEEAELDGAAPVAELVPGPPTRTPTEPLEAESNWRDETSVVIAPDEAIELKLIMTKGDLVEYEWSTDGGSLNFNKHGDGSGLKVEYDKGRATPARAGELVAAFDGHHGWFWRNRSAEAVEVTLRTRGEYAEVKRTR